MWTKLVLVFVQLAGVAIQYFSRKLQLESAKAEVLIELLEDARKDILNARKLENSVTPGDHNSDNWLRPTRSKSDASRDN